MMSAVINEHNLKAAALWGSGGRAYDAISQSMAGALDHCVTRLQPKRGERVADLATGTGLASRMVAGHGADVIGIDISEGMLAAARDIAGEHGFAIDYRLGDAEALPFEDRAFDAVISTFGVMFAPDQQRVVAELARVCRPSGRLAIAAWTPDSNAVDLRKALAPFLPPTTAAASPPSPFVWGTPGWLAVQLGGEFRVQSEAGTVISRFASAEAAWEAYFAGFGPIRGTAQALATDRREAMREVFLVWVNQFGTELGVAIPFDYLVTVAHHRSAVR